MKEYIIFGPEKWEKYFTDQVCQYLENNDNYQISIKENKVDFKLDITENHPNWYGSIRKYIFFQNNETKQFFAIDHSDQFNYFKEEIVSHPLCIGILKCQYRKGNYKQWEEKIVPFTYGVKEREAYFACREEVKCIVGTNRRMYFKGSMLRRRNILKGVHKMKLLNDDYRIKDDSGNVTLKVSQKEYLTSMAQSKIALSVPGVGNCCHREIEAFGLGVPVLMPTLKNQYYNPLIPDKHYIAADSPLLEDREITRYSTVEDDILCGEIRKRYEEAINDDKFLNYIVKNAMEWFEENIVFPSNIELIKRILLEKFNYQL